MAEQLIRSKRQTTEQRRAAQAWRDVNGVKGTDAEGEYKTLARSIPADILNHGLGQALAFLYAKGYENGSPKSNSGHAMLYRHLSAWVGGEMGWGRDADLLGKLTEDDATKAHYRRATVEALAYLEWLKRFAEAELRGGAG